LQNLPKANYFLGLNLLFCYYYIILYHTADIFATGEINMHVAQDLQGNMVLFKKPEDSNF
jgi:hypothetical protein